MAIFLGDKKVKLILDNVIYNIRLSDIASVFNGVKLLSSEGYTLKDSNGLYITAKESES